jgi:transcriptional regulator with XRE-family HTH domain
MKIKVEVFPDEFLRLMRARLELTQAQLATALGVARGTVTRYELGESKIPAVMLETVKHMVERS